MFASLSSYVVFVHDRWRWPLLQVAGLGGPAGTNIAFTDGLPILAIFGKILFQLTGAAPVLFGYWVLACFALNAVVATALVRQFGGRSLMAGVTAAVIAVSMPALLARWGHMTLMAQWLIPLSLLAYARVVSRPVDLTSFLLMAAVCLLALLTFPYLFFMVTAVALAGLGQSGLRNKAGRSVAAMSCAGLLGALIFVLWTLGYFAVGSFADNGFGIYSMNLLSPLVPQVSGLFPAAQGMVDATGGQYEGFVYLGAGLLLLTLLAAPHLWRRLPGQIGRHPLLAVVIGGSLALAVSNEVYVGNFHLVSVPVPDALRSVTGTVRSSGRLAWIALYLGAAVVVATVGQWRAAAPLLTLACGLQWIDASRLRAHVRESVAGPVATIDRAAWADALPRVSQVAIDPPFLCIAAQTDRDAQSHAAIEIQFKSAQAGVPINSVYAARARADCTVPAIAPGTLFVSMKQDGFRPKLPCASGPLLTVCHDRLAPAILAALAVTIPLPVPGDGS